MRTRDREVRRHEQAHLAAAGSYAKGGPTFEYQTGPDGQRYAVGGEVSIDTSPVAGDPKATIIKAQVIQRAAGAPADPSGQDRAVASAAAKMEAQARRELQAQEREESEEGEESQSLGTDGAAGAGEDPSPEIDDESPLPETTGRDPYALAFAALAEIAAKGARFNALA